MIHTISNSANKAWLETFRALIDRGEDTGNQKYFRDEVALIEITDPQVASADRRFPMAQADLDVINDYIVTGNNEGKVVHEWTKLYRHRAFDEPYSQVEFLISRLDAANPVGEAQISIWDKAIDQGQKVQPCTQIIWARIKHGKLEMHVHANSSDAYKKLLMNMLEFIALQHYIASRVNLEVGRYYHFVDSCHLYKKDLKQILQLQKTQPKI